jgi:hypothetical protein
MKYIITCLIGLICFFANAQQVALEGTWKLDMEQTLKKMEAPASQKLKAIPRNQQENIKSNFASRTFVFRSDNSFYVEWHDGKVQRNQTGTWTAQDRELQIQINGGIQRYVVSLTSGKLSLEKKGQSGFFKTLVFSRM